MNNKQRLERWDLVIRLRHTNERTIFTLELIHLLASGYFLEMHLRRWHQGWKEPARKLILARPRGLRRFPWVSCRHEVGDGVDRVCRGTEYCNRINASTIVHREILCSHVDGCSQMHVFAPANDALHTRVSLPD
jgi:hypothetical protein